MDLARRPLDPRTVDVLLFVGVATVLSLVATSHQTGTGPVDPLVYLWAVGLGALMLVRRQAPVFVLLLTAVGFFTYYAAGFPAIGVAVPIAAAVFSASEAGHYRAAVTTGLVVLAVSTGYRVAVGQDVAFVAGYELVMHATLIASVIGLGHSVRAHRELRENGRRMAELLSANHVMQAEQRARDERLSLARELHDSLGHSLSVASLYTDVARESGDADPTRRRDALDLVRGAISESMGHLRSTVTLLRGADRTDPPAPGLAALRSVLAAPRSAGYDVVLDLDERLDGRDLPPEVTTTAFRVVQEAVTNTLRHADASRIEVAVTAGSDRELHVVVRDNGRPVGQASAAVTGHGLRGMRERVERLGGRLEVTPGPQGWCVASSIPVEGPW